MVTPRDDYVKWPDVRTTMQIDIKFVSRIRLQTATDEQNTTELFSYVRETLHREVDDQFRNP